MQIGGTPKRIKLTEDLTRYGANLIEGAKGTTMPNAKLSIWSNEDRFVGVKFDTGEEMDILYNSLEITN